MENLKKLKEAAEQGHAIAQYYLAQMYRKGKGVTQDDVQAYIRFNKASAQGMSKASKMLDELEKLMTPEQIDRAQRGSH